MKLMRLFILLLLNLVALIALAQPTEPIAADQAFQFSATARDNQTVLALWQIEKGYYLYRDRIYFKVIKPTTDEIGQALLPATDQTKDYPGIGVMKVYTGALRIPVPIITSTANNIVLQVSYQGCSQQGFCYPPTHKIVEVNLAGNYMVPTQPLAVDVVVPNNQPTAQTITAPSAPEKIAALLTQHNLLTIVLAFLGFGILISLTPCVLPMIPILSGIIVGQGKISHGRSFALSLAYVLGMSITYALVGALFAAAGSTVQAYLQQPWIITLFSLIFIAMALSLFGLYTLELPQVLRSKLAHLSEHQKRGNYLGVFIMGVLSTLILSPCVTAPLVAVLGYISQTGNALLGAFALFFMGLGMGVPLLIVGISSAKLLPKAGRWMNITKYIMGVLMLAVAIWMLSRILPDAITMLLWSLLMIGCAVAMGTFRSVATRLAWLAKALGLLFFVYGMLLAIGALSGTTNPLRPIELARLNGHPLATTEIHFIPVTSVAEVQHQITLANKQNKPVMLDFYADWCMACIEMDRYTFTQPAVTNLLKKYVLLRADVTKNTNADKALEKYFGVIAPPTILFFNTNGQEVKSARIVGEQSANTFSQHLKKINLAV